MLDRTPLSERARGRWRGILMQIGVSADYLKPTHGPCPWCAGKDRYRFDDKGGSGSFICSKCGSGDGVEFVKRFLKVEFKQAAQAIEAQIGSAPVAVRPAGRNVELERQRMADIWAKANCLDGQDIASRYLASRGIGLAQWPISLRWAPRMTYIDDDKQKSTYPGMLAKFAAPDGKSAILHRTFLAEPGRKADIAKVRMMMPGRIPAGGAVRLGRPAETIGIGEGIETCLSAAILFGLPVWSAMTAGNLIKWQPPEECRNVIVFGDLDVSYTGQMAAYSLAYRLHADGRRVEVRFPDAEEGSDWNDVLQGRSLSPRPESAQS